MRILVDCAGARMGGAKRLLTEFDVYQRTACPPELKVIGRDRAVRVPWLLRREITDGRVDRAVALNNVGFLVAGRERHVLVHGAQHFLRHDEARTFGSLISPAAHAQAPVVRMAVRRADRVFVPSTSMAERVVHAVPSVRDRIVIAYNPVTPPDPSAGVARGSHGDGDGEQPMKILCPLLFSPHKRMADHLRVALAALDLLAAPPHPVEAVLTVTERASHPEAGPLAGHPRLRLIGPQSPATVTDMLARSDAVYFPSEFESFGYPLAEGRVMGVPVVALDSPHNREIAGAALTPYPRESPDEVASAIIAALTAEVRPDQSGLFDRGPYFDRLLGLRSGSTSTEVGATRSRSRRSRSSRSRPSRS
ncbi:Glycosyltransferase [Frankia canadensis]|uniref:Glycosyltransferase n=1 Tax=Frankia canadensis TaxID=1836972 RepID=A0A2I2KZL5_9ACTN|nr:glycosyltransferase [Frankia canadensis]SNQ51106.1 Glycosyltransferase [Frankia canadensis]SOU58396.1 Glycosyltransferase [Frankia canadensis]